MVHTKDGDDGHWSISEQSFKLVYLKEMRNISYESSVLIKSHIEKRLHKSIRKLS